MLELFQSIRLGPKRIIRCPVDDRLRMAGNVNYADLNEQEIEYARTGIVALSDHEDRDRKNSCKIEFRLTARSVKPNTAVLLRALSGD